MIEQKVRTIDELLNFVHKIYQVHGLRLWYRGVMDAGLVLLPSIQRSERRIQCERMLVNDFYVRTKPILEKCPDKKNYAAWMSLMQHYGLPTRLLDWSQSPLIAGFFATETYYKNPGVDACVWVLAPARLNEREGFGDYIYPLDADTAQDMLLPAFKERGHNPELADKIIACRSTESNMRMYSQQANFTVHNSLRKLVDICDQETLYKIIIPADRRQYFLESLRVFGITEGFVYPEPEHISNDLRRLYGI